jgi:hypothetical protein
LRGWTLFRDEEKRVSGEDENAQLTRKEERERERERES